MLSEVLLVCNSGFQLNEEYYEKNYYFFLFNFTFLGANDAFHAN
jgi:hypothetical protein